MSDKNLKNMMVSTNRENLDKFQKSFDKEMAERIRKIVKSNLFETSK